MNSPTGHARWTGWALVALACLVLGAPARAQGSGAPAHHAKLDSVVREAVASGRGVRAIIRFHSQGARERGEGIVASRGGALRRSLHGAGTTNAIIDATTVDELALDEGVAHISVDAEVRSSAGPGSRWVPSSGSRSVRARHGRRAQGISVAIIDSGVQPHADLPASRIRAFVDFVNGRTRPYDDFGHGSHVAGILAGSGVASSLLDQPYIGVAPEVDIVALKVLDSHGAGSTSDVIAALEWVAAHYVAYNIRVVNLSLGHPVYELAATDPLVQAAEALVELGIVVVASAGNMGVDPRDGVPGYGGITSPANGPSIIAVGAVDAKQTAVRSDDRVTDYSSRGPTRFDLLAKPDLVAPGQDVVSLSAPGSLLFERYPDLHVTGGTESVPAYMMLSGTSMSAPAVSGAAALVLHTNPGLTAHTVRAVLEFTAQRLPDTNVMTQGAGYLNTLGAVRLAGSIKPQAPIGSVWLRPHTIPLPSDEIFGEHVAWAKNIVWGERMLLGDSVYVRMVAWNDNIAWGANLDNIGWGDCVRGRCGDNLVSGEALDSIVWGECVGADCADVGSSDGDDNIVWSEAGLRSYWASNTVSGFWADSVLWSSVTPGDGDHIVWGEDYLDKIVWGECTGDECGEDADSIVWGENLLILTGGGR